MCIFCLLMGGIWLTNVEAIEILRGIAEFFGRDCLPNNAIDAINMAIYALEEQTTIELYDQEEIHENCTVQVLRNSVTGDVSIGWWEGDGGEF